MAVGSWLGAVRQQDASRLPRLLVTVRAAGPYALRLQHNAEKSECRAYRWEMTHLKN